MMDELSPAEDLPHEALTARQRHACLGQDGVDDAAGQQAMQVQLWRDARVEEATRST